MIAGLQLNKDSLSFTIALLKQNFPLLISFEFINLFNFLNF
ncbi:hypothetical protein PRO82_000088 [Candidatus Protochlamydia amoebophila]|nr:hypothetical protein [Candidatus Protochlamydia amoebophila]